MDCMKNAIDIARENEIMAESSSQKRFYECSFCKRGFSNAQALGGHMNIHRKDRGRIGSTPRKVAHISSSSSSRLHVLAPKPYSSAWETNTCPSKYTRSFFDGQCSSSLRRDYEILGANLSLKIVDDVDLAEIIKSEEHEGDEIDLELRLSYCR